MRAPRTSAGRLATLLGGAGALHLLVPRPFEQLVPRQLGHARGLTYASGVAELGIAALLLHPATRPTGGRAAAALFLAVAPANLSMATDAQRWSPRMRRVGWARLPLQVPLVVWAWRVGQSR